MKLEPRHLLPRPGTLLLGAAMALCWWPIVTDRIEEWGTLGDEVGVPLLLALFVGLCGVYGATVADKMTVGISQRGKLALAFLRTALLGSLAAAIIGLLS